MMRVTIPRETRRRNASALVLAPLAIVLALLAPHPVHAASDPVLYRIFLKDGATLVSYGEFVRMDDRVVFTRRLAPEADVRS